MYLELDMSLGVEGDIKLTIDTEKNLSIVLRLTNRDGSTVVGSVEPQKLGQFVINTKRYLTMTHEDNLLDSDELDDDE